jgi:hypothetical protein
MYSFFIYRETRHWLLYVLKLYFTLSLPVSHSLSFRGPSDASVTKFTKNNLCKYVNFRIYNLTLFVLTVLVVVNLLLKLVTIRIQT